MGTFDAPDRETCRVRRARTNTPLQALVLMNDVQFFEAARCFAERLVEAGVNEQDRLTFAFRSATARYPSDRERETLMGLYREYRAEFAAHPEAAAQLLKAGESSVSEAIDPVELAAWTMVTHLILNLDEVVTKG
jgi:hypothetical protein